jgi:hypothetical protein
MVDAFYRNARSTAAIPDNLSFASDVRIAAYRRLLFFPCDLSG